MLQARSGSADLESRVVIDLVLDGHDVIGTALVFIDFLNLLLVSLELSFLVTDHITQLHLLLYQVLSLSKGAYKLVSFFPLHLQVLVLLSNSDSCQVPFLEVKLNLLVAELLP